MEKQLVAGHPQHKGAVVSLQLLAQLPVSPVNCISRQPTVRHAGLLSPLKHGLSQARFGGKTDGLRNGSLAASWRIGGPLLGQIQCPVQKGGPVSADIAKKHADLTVLDPACRAAVLAFDPCRAETFLDKPRLVDDKYGLCIAKLLDYVGAQIVPYLISVSAGGVQQTLYPVASPIVSAVCPPFLRSVLESKACK